MSACDDKTVRLWQRGQTEAALTITTKLHNLAEGDGPKKDKVTLHFNTCIPIGFWCEYIWDLQIYFSESSSFRNATQVSDIAHGPLVESLLFSQKILVHCIKGSVSLSNVVQIFYRFYWSLKYLFWSILSQMFKWTLLIPTLNKLGSFTGKCTVSKRSEECSVLLHGPLPDSHVLQHTVHV